MKRTGLFIIVFFWYSLTGAQTFLEAPLSDRTTGYEIDVELMPDSKIVKGNMNAYWINRSGSGVSEVQLHMYLNAFRSNKSTFYRESGGSPGYRKTDYGWVDITSIHDSEGNDLFDRMFFIQPDDNNPDDMTVLRIELPEPVAPGDTVWLNMDFESKLPAHIRRTGYNEDFFFVAQWFPKFGVYETAGMRYASKDGWNCHQFHSHSEFYSNHSVYEVSITLPDEYVVGSGGMLQKEEVLDDGRKKLFYRAEDIVDFAWTAWPSYKLAEDQWEHVSISFLYPPGRENQVERQLGAVKNGLKYFSEHVGPYPWPHLTFVDPPSIGSGAGGMEYTTIFTSSSSGSIPEFVLMPEMVTVHEFGHAYFMGILASNEFEEPWMDEGINSYMESRAMDHFYGPGKGIINHKKFAFSDRSMQRLSYVQSEDKMVVDNTPTSWEYPHGTYSMMSYSKAATVLWTLQGILGEETMDDIFREYYRVWGFKYPTGRDFIDLVNRVVSENHADKYGESMDWFFDQTLFGTGVCDYKLDGISNLKQRSFRGIVKSDTGMVVKEESTLGDSLYLSTVRIQRLGEVMLPVELLVHFDSGREELEQWDGRERYKNFEYLGAEKVLWAKLDPDNKITMDIDLINNSYTTEDNHVPVKAFFRRLSVLSQYLIHLLTL